MFAQFMLFFSPAKTHDPGLRRRSGGAGGLLLAGAFALSLASCSGERKSTAERSPPPPVRPATPPAVAAVSDRGSRQSSRAGEFAAGIAYTNYRYADIPWSLQVVRLDRAHRELELHSAVAGGVICGLSTLSELIEGVPPSEGVPLAGVNGDFFLRDRDYAGDPRGLQIVDGDLVSGPTGGAALWIDGAGYPHVEEVASNFKVTLPDGSNLAFGLNEARRFDAAVLYTASLGPSTRTRDGEEVVLEKAGDGPWYPLRIGETFSARVKEVRTRPDTRLHPQILVLSIGPVLAARLPRIAPGALLTISTATVPDLRGAETAIGGGPVLVRDGRTVEIERPRSLRNVSYSVRSMFERHPRSAVGWNDDAFYLVEVDGRQRQLSMGMTLTELSTFMRATLGCTHALNLDGGGSATFWADGRTRNSPCEGRERELANAVLVVRKNGGSKLAGGRSAGSSAAGIQ